MCLKCTAHQHCKGCRAPNTHTHICVRACVLMVKPKGLSIIQLIDVLKMYYFIARWRMTFVILEARCVLQLCKKEKKHRICRMLKSTTDGASSSTTVSLYLILEVKVVGQLRYTGRFVLLVNVHVWCTYIVVSIIYVVMSSRKRGLHKVLPLWIRNFSCTVYFIVTCTMFV